MNKMFFLGFFLSALAQAAPLSVSATTTILADFVQNVGGQRVQVHVIVPSGGDTHTFQPTTGAIRQLASSKLLFANGAGLEPWLPKLKAAVPQVPHKLLTNSLKLRPAPDEHGDHDHAAYDPHAWWDTDLAAGYVKNIQQALIALDPAGKATYNRNASAYIAQLRAADGYAKKRLASIPPAKRKIVTNHDSLHYLAQRYGLQVVGAVIPGLSTEREPSARELAQLAQAVKKTGARAIFIENTVAPRLAQTLSKETGVKIAPPLYTDALGPKGSAGATYLGALRANVDTIASALQ